MAKDQVTLYNMALSAIGTRSSLSSTTEEAREAEMCNIWYEHARDLVLRAAFWPSARKYVRLALLAERDTDEAWTVDDPTPDYLFAYGVPSDLIAPRYLTTFAPFTMEWYTPSGKAAKLAIHTNQEKAILCYSFRQTNPATWDDSLFMAAAYALASHIAMPLHGKLGRARESAERANTLILQARANVANAEERRYDTIPPWIEARGYSEAGPRTRFIWPYGPLLATTGEKTVASSPA